MFMIYCGMIEGVKYQDVFHQAEKEFSAYNFEHANVDILLKYLICMKMKQNPCRKKNIITCI
jgi:glycyl-tRNA synthetase alpha chain